MTWTLPPASANHTVAALRKTLGVGPDEPVEVDSSPIKRPAHWASAVDVPTRAFAALRRMTAAELRELGCKPWDEADHTGRELLLFPAEWYDAIPNGYVLESILGREVLFLRGVTDDDRRMGLLPYGLRAPVRKGRAKR